MNGFRSGILRLLNSYQPLNYGRMRMMGAVDAQFLESRVKSDVLLGRGFAGHAKWQNIRARKGEQDRKKAKLMVKLAHNIRVAVKNGGNSGDPKVNLKLNNAIANAKANSMPKDKIEYAIDVALKGESKDTSAEFVLYEASGPSSFAFLIETLTDKKTRTAPLLRKVLSANGSNLGSSTKRLFERIGILEYELKDPENTWENFVECAMNAGANDVDWSDDLKNIQVTTEFSALHEIHENLKKYLIENGLSESIQVIQNGAKYRAKSPLTFQEKSDEHQRLETIIDELMELDDVQEVFHNAEIESNSET